MRDFLTLGIGPDTGRTEARLISCRGDQSECISLLYAVIATAQGEISYATPGALTLKSFLRSSAKPFQAMPLVISGLFRDLPKEALAIACASHMASAEHLHWVGDWLNRLAPDGVALLQCGPHPPLDEETRNDLIRRYEHPTPVHNNCSGKHAAMLYCVQKQGWDTATYLEPDHPLQQEIYRLIADASGEKEIPVAVDGCGAPTYYMPLSAMARLYAVLAGDGSGGGSQFQPVAQAMITHPVLVGGQDRVDTAIMIASGGALLAKVGAEGLLCVSRLGKNQGLAVKVLDGSGPVRDIAVVHLLHQLGWLDEAMWQHPELTPWRSLDRLNTQGRVIGHYEILWPRFS